MKMSWPYAPELQYTKRVPTDSGDPDYDPLESLPPPLEGQTDARMEP